MLDPTDISCIPIILLFESTQNSFSDTDMFPGIDALMTTIRFSYTKYVLFLRRGKKTMTT